MKTLMKSRFSVCFWSVLLGVGILMSLVAGTADAKSLYLIAGQQSPTPIQAYDIQVDNTLAYQTTSTVTSTDWGPVGLAIDTDSAILFITYESRNLIRLADATTMTSIGTTTAPGATNLAGIVVDQENQKVYIVDRNTDNLYVYSWDPCTTTLTLDQQYDLPNISSAFGLALDEINDILYVSANTTTVYYYSTADFTTLAGTVTVQRDAIGIAVDVTDGFLYTGAGWSNNKYLNQYNLATDVEKEVLVGTQNNDGVMGIAVDSATGYVYCTTGFFSDAVVAFNPADLNEIDRHGVNDNAPGNPYYGPTGVCIPGKEVSYNPLNLTKDDGIEEDDDPNCVPAGGTITYDICYDNAGNSYDVTNVTIVDTLSDDVSFVSATGGGTYDSVTHTVTWDIGDLSAGDPGGCVQLVVQVDSDTPPGTVLDNACEINADEPGTGPTTIHEFTDVCLNQPPDCSEAYADPGCLWPPNHKMVAVSILGVTDPDGDPVTITITGITSDEATASDEGAGGAKHAPDAAGVGTDTASLRAERSGKANGRVYVINFIATDGKGGECEGSVEVNVPHDQRPSRRSPTPCEAGDDGQVNDATQIN